MQTKFRMTTLGVVVLAMGLVAGPALAQQAEDADEIEGFTSVRECQAAVRQVSDGAGTGVISDGLRDRIQELLDGGARGQICTIYIPVDFEPPGPPPTVPPVEPPEVGGEVIDRPATPGTPGTPATPPTPQVPATPGSPTTGGVSVEAPEVLGVTLSRTGADAGLLVLLGAGLLGLGAVAVRRTRSSDVA
jgi:hypothetical protein